MIAENIQKLLWTVAKDKRYSKVACELILHTAIDFYDLNLVKELVNNHGYHETPNSDGYSPLHLAVFNGDQNIVKYLLEVGANPNQMSIFTYETPMHFASMSGNQDIFLMLLDHGGDINLFNKKKITVFEMLLVYNHEDLFVNMVESCHVILANIDSVTMFKSYEYACYKQYNKAIDLLKAFL